MNVETMGKLIRNNHHYRAFGSIHISLFALMHSHSRTSRYIQFMSTETPLHFIDSRLLFIPVENTCTTGTFNSNSIFGISGQNVVSIGCGYCNSFHARVCVLDVSLSTVSTCVCAEGCVESVKVEWWWPLLPIVQTHLCSTPHSQMGPQ